MDRQDRRVISQFLTSVGIVFFITSIISVFFRGDLTWLEVKLAVFSVVSYAIGKYIKEDK